MTTAIKSISVSIELDAQAQEQKIGWSEAARVGMSVLLADKGVKQYDNDLNLYRKMRAYQQQLENTTAKLNELMEKRIDKDIPQRIEKRDNNSNAIQEAEAVFESEEVKE